MRYIFLFNVFFSMLIVMSCTKKGNVTNSAANFSVTVGIMVENQQGQSLLDPTTVGAFNVGDINLYNLVNGQEKLFYRPNWDDPKGIGILSYNGTKYTLSIYPNTETEDNPATTYIDWGNGDRDTLVCKMEKDASGYYYFTTDVWFNGEKVLPDKRTTEGMIDKTFKIVK